MDREALLEMWSKFIAGEALSAREESSLLGALERDPALREELLSDRELDGTLRALGQASRDGDAFAQEFSDRLAAEKDASRFVEDVREKLTARRSSSRRIAPALRRRSAAASPAVRFAWLAAAGVLLAATVLFLRGRPADRAAPRQTAMNPPAPVRVVTERLMPETTSPSTSRPIPMPEGPAAAPETDPDTRTPARPPGPASVAQRSETGPAVAAGADDRGLPSRTRKPHREASQRERPAERTERPVARVAEVRGQAKYTRDGKNWAALTAGISIMAGDRIDAAAGRVRIELAGGSSLWTNRRTVISLHPEADGADVRVRIRHGEVYVDDVSGYGSRVAGPVDASAQPATRNSKLETGKVLVETYDGVFTPLGTRFDVDRSGSATILTVEQGAVEVRGRTKDGGEGKAVRVKAGFRSRVLRGQAPTTPVRANLSRVLAWAKGSRPKALFADGFQKGAPGRWPQGWRRHPTEPGTRSGYAVRGETGKPNARYLACTSTGGTTQHAFIPLAKWPDAFTVSMRFRLTGTRNTRVGVQFDAPNRAFTVSVQYNAAAGQVEMRVSSRGSQTLARQAPLKLSTGVWHTFAVRVEGEAVACTVNGRKVLDARQRGLRPVSGVSLLSRGADPAHYSDVKVLPQ